MSELLNNISLKGYNTFGIDVKTRHLFSFDDEEDLISLIKANSFSVNDILVIGGGSNLLFVEDFDGLIIYPQNKTLEILQEEEDDIYIRVGAGYNWDDLVAYCVSRGWGGLENLSDIPGNVGASPVQNIGAYGVEIADKIHSVDLVNIETGGQLILEKEQCEFGYRDSVFKNKYKNLFVVTHVVYQLSKKGIVNLSYGFLEQEVLKLGESTIANVRKAVCNIRETKLPDPKLLGNCGSFFKNPILSKEDVEYIKKEYPDMPTYNTESGKIKLAAGWIIDQCGWKGYKEGDVGVHKDQALVLVNYGRATGLEIVRFANKIKNSVFMKFGVILELEVKVI